MRPVNLLLFLVILILVSGCAVKPMFSGPYYLSTENYESGITTLEQEFRKNPENPSTNFYLGRLYLADKKPAEALPYLESAALLKPKDVDYHFWLGVAYSQNNKPALERKSYLKALSLDEKHYQAWTYLGHNQMDHREYQAAQISYSRALLLKKDIPDARFNRALALQKLKRAPEAIQAWKDYLDRYPTGSKARTAADNLNLLGDFSYRNSLIGKRVMTLKRVEFDPLTGEISGDSYSDLKVVGETIEGHPDTILHIVSYQRNNSELAETKAKNVKKYLLKKFSNIPMEQIGVSWFGKPEIVRKNGRKFTIEESVHLFSKSQRK